MDCQTVDMLSIQIILFSKKKYVVEFYKNCYPISNSYEIQDHGIYGETRKYCSSLSIQRLKFCSYPKT